MTPSEQRSNSLARLRAATLDLEREICRKEVEQERLSKEMTEVRTLLVQQHRALETLKEQLESERTHAADKLKAAEQSSQSLQDEQDAFLALLLDEHEQELEKLRQERDDALAQSAMAEHTRRRVSVEQDLAARIDWLRGECDAARSASDEAEKRADAAERRFGDAEAALTQARSELGSVRRELASMRQELTEARLGVAEAKSEAQDARRARDRAQEQRDRAVEEIERLRNLISGTDLRQRPTDPAQKVVKVPRSESPTPVAAPDPSTAKRTAPAVPRPEQQPESDSESKIALGRVDLRSSASKLRPAKPVVADGNESTRQTKPTTPSMPAMRAQPGSGDLETLPPPPLAGEPEFEVGHATAEDVLAPLTEEHLDAAALDMTRDLAWEGVDEPGPEPTERRSSRPVGPAERPPVMRKKPLLERSPGGYSMPPDASGTIEVLHPIGPNKR